MPLQDVWIETVICLDSFTTELFKIQRRDDVIETARPIWEMIESIRLSQPFNIHDKVLSRYTSRLQELGVADVVPSEFTIDQMMDFMKRIAFTCTIDPTELEDAVNTQE